MAERVTIRTARGEEADVLSRIAFRAKAHWGYDAAFMAACRAELTYTEAELAAGLFRVLERDTLVAFHALGPLVGSSIELEALFVAPEWIGRGLGRQLLLDARRLASEAGALTMTIQSDPHAEPFYIACGARRVGERESESVPGRLLPLLELVLR